MCVCVYVCMCDHPCTYLILKEPPPLFSLCLSAFLRPFFFVFILVQVMPLVGAAAAEGSSCVSALCALVHWIAAELPEVTRLTVHTSIASRDSLTALFQAVEAEEASTAGELAAALPKAVEELPEALRPAFQAGERLLREREHGAEQPGLLPRAVGLIQTAVRLAEGSPEDGPSLASLAHSVSCVQSGRLLARLAAHFAGDPRPLVHSLASVRAVAARASAPPAVGQAMVRVAVMASLATGSSLGSPGTDVTEEDARQSLEALGLLLTHAWDPAPAKLTAAEIDSSAAKESSSRSTGSSSSSSGSSSSSRSSSSSSRGSSSRSSSSRSSSGRGGSSSSSSSSSSRRSPSPQGYGGDRRHGSSGGDRSGSWRAGDWMCDVCGDHCFASRTVCRCGAPKGTGGGQMQAQQMHHQQAYAMGVSSCVPLCVMMMKCA